MKKSNTFGKLSLALTVISLVATASAMASDAVDCSHLNPATGIVENGNVQVANATSLNQLPAGAYLKFQSAYGLTHDTSDIGFTNFFNTQSAEIDDLQYSWTTRMVYPTGSGVGNFIIGLIPIFGYAANYSEIPAGSEAVIGKVVQQADASFDVSFSSVIYPGYSASAGTLTLDYSVSGAADPHQVANVGELVAMLGGTAAVCAAQ